nr:reverse transcriptase domain-containing protein [Actinospica robiniae]
MALIECGTHAVIDAAFDAVARFSEHGLARRLLASLEPAMLLLADRNFAGYYKIWNRLSSGTYFPPPVRAAEIPKPHGGGTRILGVPSVADRVEQTAVAEVLEKRAEPVFHLDSCGYRPKRSALDAVAICRRRCWKTDWVIDLDIQKFFDSVPWDLVVKAAEAVCDLPWVVLYVKRWLMAPLTLPDGRRGWGGRARGGVGRVWPW